MQARGYKVENTVLIGLVAYYLLNDILLINWSWSSRAVYLFDHASRVIQLAILLGIPQTRRAIAQLIGHPAGVWTCLAVLVSITVLDLLFFRTGVRILHYSLPETAYFDWPILDGWGLYLFDLTVGLALVALAEELIGRKLMRRFLERAGCTKRQVIWASAIVFALFHWSTGIPNLAFTFVAGWLAMSAYYYCNQLWPCIVAHYIVNFAIFSRLL